MIGLNGGLAYRQGQMVYEEQLDKDVSGSPWLLSSLPNIFVMIPLIIADRIFERFSM